MPDISRNSIGLLNAHEQILVYHSVFYSSMLAENLKVDIKFPSVGSVRREFYYSTSAYFLISGK